MSTGLLLTLLHGGSAHTIHATSLTRERTHSEQLTGKPDCDLKAVGMIVRQGGNGSDRASHRTGKTLGGRVMNDGSVTFGWFVRNRFFPLKEVKWRPETAKVKKLIIQKDLIEPFDGIPLENFDRFTLQVHLNQLGRTRSKDRVLQIKAYVKDIFAEAVEQDFLIKDPARKVTVPTQLRDTDKITLTWEQLRDALARLTLRDRILLEFDMTNALRPSELFALRWKCFKYEESRMKVVETAYKGALRPWGKNKRSLGWVHLPKGLAEDLWLCKQESPDASPEAFIFPDAKGGFMDTGNYRKRVLHKLAQELELPKRTFIIEWRCRNRNRGQRRWKRKIKQGCQGHIRTKRLPSLAGAGSQATLLHFQSRDNYFP